MSSSIQLGLFDDPPRSVMRAEPMITRTKPDTQQVVRLTLAPRHRARPHRRPPPSRVLTAKDMPAYSDEQIAEVERIIAGVKSDRLLLGYKDVQELFGVSKATANRRMKEGLVPGVTIHNGVVSRDAAVRRFSLEQVKWLLLAVRSSKQLASA